MASTPLQEAASDHEPRSVCTTVVETVAEAAGVSELELEPLYDAIDPDALEVLFRPGAVGRVEFSYQGHAVTVHSDGQVDVAGC
jgi:hypothetical protein